MRYVTHKQAITPARERRLMPLVSITDIRPSAEDDCAPRRRNDETDKL